MPRTMPGLVQRMSNSFHEARNLVNAIEDIRFAPETVQSIRKRLHYHRIELVYELAYLKAFVQWENFLEDSFLRFLAGYTHVGVQIVPIQPPIFNLADARTRLYGGNQYLLWHNPDKVIARANNFFMISPYLSVLNSDLARLRAFSAIRHRVAHASDDACSKFDSASMALAGRRFGGSKAGSMLRSKDQGALHPARWIDTIFSELENLAAQILP